MTNIAKMAKITNLTKFQTQKKKKPRQAPKCPQISQKSQIQQEFFLLAGNTHDKYRKYRTNNKCTKNADLERKEAKKGPEMSANIAKIAKATRIFLASLKHP